MFFVTALCFLLFSQPRFLARDQMPALVVADCDSYCLERGSFAMNKVSDGFISWLLGRLFFFASTCLRVFSKAAEIRMDEGDMYESEVITFVAPKKSGWLKKKSTGKSF